MIHNHNTSEKIQKTSKSAEATAKHADKKLADEDWDIEVDEYEFDAPKSSHGCGCGCNSHKDNY